MGFGGDMEPTHKAPAIERLLEKVAKRTSSIQTNKCVPAPIGCGQSITGFKDELSAREYRISGLCQNCQDAFFK